MKLVKCAILSMLLNGSLNAEDIKIVGTITKKVTIPTANQSKQRQLLGVAAATKEITLLKLQLSNRAQKQFEDKAKAFLKSPKPVFSDQGVVRGSKVNLGMNDVPVFDQGAHGTCVVFANSAAIDAALNKGDYISQLCQLMLGNYLEKYGYGESGWNGSWGRMVLNQIESFGIVSKEQQLAESCGGIATYPVENKAPNVQMNPEEFHQISENIDQEVIWSPILDVYQAISDRVDTNKILNDVKLALKAGDRLTFGVMLLDFDLGFFGAVGSYNNLYDSWVLTPEIARDIYLKPEFAWHEMVITGFDDNAIVVDEQGRRHRGLITLRNSWGNTVGDQGNFYMSYDYFKLLVIEVQRIRRVNMMV